MSATVYPTATAANDIGLLYDCKAFCLPDQTLYFTTGVQSWPHIIFDLLTERIVFGVQIYLRLDDPKYAQGDCPKPCFFEPVRATKQNLLFYLCCYLLNGLTLSKGLEKFEECRNRIKHLLVMS